MNKQEKAHKEKLDRNEAFIKFLERAEGDFKGLEFRNSDYFKENYGLNFIIHGKVQKDYPLSAKLFYGNKPFAVYTEGNSIKLPAESGAYLHFDQQPNSMVSITLCHPSVGDDSPFSGFDIGLVRPHRLLKKSYQRKLFHVLVTSMENYSFSGNPSCIDKLLLLYYNEKFRQIKEGKVFESKLSKQIWAIIKWAICGIIGGYIAGYTASRFPTTIKNSQFERYDSILIQSKEELSSVKQELLNITEGFNIQLDSINQSLRGKKEEK